MPTLNIACSGQGVVGTKEDWAKFANGDGRFREGMERLYDLFRSAPELGSLLDPHTVTEDLFALGFDTLKGTVERALKKFEARDDPDRAALGVAAQGIAMAASLMSGVHACRNKRPLSCTWEAVRGISDISRRRAPDGKG